LGHCSRKSEPLFRRRLVTEQVGHSCASTTAIYTSVSNDFKTKTLHAALRRLYGIQDAGELTRIGAIPAHDDVLVSPGAESLAWTAPATTGGEVTSIPALEAQTVDGTQHATLTALAGWGFSVRAWVWEGRRLLGVPVVGDGGGRERMARCSAQSARCVLSNTH